MEEVEIGWVAGWDEDGNVVISPLFSTAATAVESAVDSNGGKTTK